MSEETHRVWVEQRLIAAMPVSYPTVSIEFPNIKFIPTKNEPYVRYTILGGEGAAAEVGDGIDRQVGILQLDVLVPTNSGAGLLTRLSDYCVKMFARQSAVLTDGAYLRHRTGYSTYLGVNDGLARRSCSIPYWRDEK